MVYNDMSVKIPFRVSLPFVIEKVEKAVDVGGDVYITLLASDTEVDYQGDRMDVAVLEKVAKDAKDGKITLRRHHSDSFYIAKSVDGEVRYTPSGLAQLFITFKAVKLGDTYYPEILHIVDMYNNQGKLPLQASVGGWITNYTTTLHKGRPVRIIKDAIVDHVALTPLEGAVNPRTFVRDILIKSLLQAIDEYERKEGLTMWQQQSEEMIAPAQTEEVGRQPFGKEKILQDLEKCGIERRKIAYTQQDIENLKKRVEKYGILPSPVGNIVKPEIYLDIPDDEFADPVNYLFPLRKDYIPASLEFAKTMSTTFLSIYDTQSAKIVYERLVKAAIAQGIPVEFTGSPTDALLDEGLAAQLPGFRPDIYTMLKSWVENLEDYYIKIAAGLWEEVLDASHAEEWRKEVAKRAEKYGYLPIPLAKAKPHPLFEGYSPTKFADPVGYLFPITPEWVLFSYRAFVSTPVRHFYSPEGAKFVYGRLLKGLERIGALVVFDPTFDLNWHFINSPVFVGVDDYLDDVEEMKKSIDWKWKDISVESKYLTHSMILWKQNPVEHFNFAKHYMDVRFGDDMKDFQSLGLQLTLDDELEEEEKRLEKADAVTTIQNAPMFPFVIPPTSTLRRRKGEPSASVVVFPHLLSFTTHEKKPKVLPQDAIIINEIVDKFGLKDAPEIKSKEIKLVWVGPDKLATPIAVVDGKGAEKMRSQDIKNPDVGFTVWGGLQAIRKGEVVAEWAVLSDGTVILTAQLPLLPSPFLSRLRKDDTPAIDIMQYLERIICETFGVTKVMIESLGIATVIWNDLSPPEKEKDSFLVPDRLRIYMSPIRIENGKIVVEPVKVHVMRHYVVEGEENEAEIFSIFVRALRRAGASDEWEKWASQFVEVVPVSDVVERKDAEEESEDEWEREEIAPDVRAKIVADEDESELGEDEDEQRLSDEDEWEEWEERVGTLGGIDVVGDGIVDLEEDEVEPPLDKVDETADDILDEWDEKVPALYAGSGIDEGEVDSSVRKPSAGISLANLVFRYEPGEEEED